MNQEETVALFERCELARAKAWDEAVAAGKNDQAADNIAQEAARAIWNDWAEKMPARRKWMEATGLAGKKLSGDFEPRSETAHIWLENATANFSGLRFQVGNVPAADGEAVAGIKTISVRTDIRLNGWIRFDGFIFPGIAQFKETQFSGRAWFDETQFAGEACFDEARFLAGAWFGRSKFSNTASFLGARFLGNTHFRGAHFSGRANFDQAVFCCLAEFKDVHVFGRALFHKARFCGDAEFGGAQFSGRALFKEAQFAKAGFQWVQFENDASFGGATFSGDADFSLARFNYFADFADAHFDEGANFNAIRGEQAFSLANATFKTVPDFIQAHFAEAPRLDHMELKEIPELGGFRQALRVKGTKETTSKYRALKRLSIQGHDHERERIFFKGEMRSRRFSEPESLPIRFANYAYDLVSDFGYSFWRPLPVWAGFVAIFAVVYWLSASPLACPDAPGQSTYLSVRSGLGVLGRFKDQHITAAYQCLYGEEFPPSPTAPGPGVAPAKSQPPGTPAIPIWITFVEFLQSLISIILLFLMVLGVRNQFRIK